MPDLRPLSPDELRRYARQIVLPEIGGPGQQALKRSRVLIAGAGGLGAPAALYLAGAGAGTLILADHDAVGLDNLHRQILYVTADAGRAKTDAAQDRLTALNPHAAIERLDGKLDAASAAQAASRADIVLDATDNYETRYALNAACHDQGKPLVSGAVERFSGQVSLFASGLTKDQPLAGRWPCYRCLVPETPPNPPSCAEIGVAGPAAGLIGSWMALEAIKWIAGAGETLTGRVALFDGLKGEARTIALKPDPACPVCGEGA